MNKRQFCENYSLLEIVNNINYCQLKSVEIFSFSRVAYLALLEFSAGRLAIIRVSKDQRKLIQRRDKPTLDRLINEANQQFLDEVNGKQSLINRIREKLISYLSV